MGTGTNEEGTGNRETLFHIPLRWISTLEIRNDRQDIELTIAWRTCF
jgi:hypothetical protein